MTSQLVVLVMLLCDVMLLYAAPLTCTYEYRHDMTLDKNGTIGNGAQINLVTSTTTSDISACAQTCCDHEMCMMGLLDSLHGRCFLLNCHPIENCVWIPHPNLTSIITHHTASTAALLDAALGTSTGSTTGTHSSDITSAPDQEHLNRLLGTSPGADIYPSNGTTINGTSSTVTTTGGYGITGDVTSGTSAISGTTGTGTSDGGSTTGTVAQSDHNQQTILDLALLNNLTTGNSSMSRDQINDLLAKLIIKSGLTELTPGGVALTLSQISDSDVTQLVRALQTQATPTATATSTSTKSINPQSVDVIMKLIEKANLTEPGKPGETVRDRVNRLLGKLITNYGLTNLTRDGATYTISQLTEDDLTSLVEKVTSSTDSVNEDQLTRDRGDPTSDHHANVTVQVVNGRDKVNATKQNDVITTSSDATARNATLITALTIGCIFTILVFVIVGKRFYDGWERRHYNKIDHLINGIYQ